MTRIDQNPAARNLTVNDIPAGVHRARAAVFVAGRRGLREAIRRAIAAAGLAPATC